MKQVSVLRVGVVVLLAALSAIATRPLLAQGDPHNGTWVLVVEKSKYSPGPAPKSQTSVYVVSGQSIKLSSNSVSAAGAAATTEFTANFDGKDYPVKGNADYDTTSVKRIDASTIEFARKRAGKVVQTATSAVAKDGKSRTVTITGVNAQGQKVNNVALYVKK